MKAKVTAEISGILPITVKVTETVDFGENSNVFGRVYDARQAFYKKFNVERDQVKITQCEYI